MKKIFVLLLIFNSTLITIAQNWVPLQGGLTNGGGNVLYSDSVTNKLFVGGDFWIVNGYPDDGVVSWNGSQWDTSYDLCSFCGSQATFSISRYQNKLYVSGIDDFHASGKEINQFTRWNGTSWDSLISTSYWNPRQFCEYNNLLYIVGLFDSVENIHSPIIVAWDGINMIPIGLPNYLSGGIAASCVYQNELFVSGTFQDSVGNLIGCAKYDGTNWTEVGLGGGGLVKTMVVYNNQLYIGGQYIGPNFKNLVKYDGVNFTDIDLYAGDVLNLRVIDNKLFVVGYIDTAGGIPIHDNIAIWDGNNWSDFSTDTFNNATTDIAVFNNELYVTGGFTMINSDTINRIAKYNGWFVGENEVKNKSGISVYPNPTSGIITFSNNSQLSSRFNRDNSQLIITDVLGSEVYHQLITNNSSLITQIDVSAFSNGMYFYRITSNKETLQGKFVKTN